jgi:hypothetical protein
MAKRNLERTSAAGEVADDSITRGTGNVFADLGYAHAGERQTKLRLEHAVNGVIARWRLNQGAAAKARYAASGA